MIRSDTLLEVVDLVAVTWMAVVVLLLISRIIGNSFLKSENKRDLWDAEYLHDINYGLQYVRVGKR